MFPNSGFLPKFILYTLNFFLCTDVQVFFLRKPMVHVKGHKFKWMSGVINSSRCHRSYIQVDFKGHTFKWKSQAIHSSGCQRSYMQVDVKGHKSSGCHRSYIQVDVIGHTFKWKSQVIYSSGCQRSYMQVDVKGHNFKWILLYVSTIPVHSCLIFICNVEQQ